MNTESLFNKLKSKDKQKKFAALKYVKNAHRLCNKKRELLKLLNKNTFSEDWENRYAAVMGISRYRWTSENFSVFKKTYENILRLIEDPKGRVRIVARNCLTKFYGLFISNAFSITNQRFDKKEILEVWLNSLLSLWDKTNSTEEGAVQFNLLRSVETLFRFDMEEYLKKTQIRKYKEICKKINELNYLYNEFRY